jgi:hypothetical protein
MNNLAKIVSSKVQEGLRLVKSLVQGSNDSREAYLVQPFGEDSAPDENSGLIGLYAYTGHNGEPVLIGYVYGDSKVKSGEKRLFSTDGQGSEQMFIYFTQEAELHLGGDKDFVTRFNEMEKAFNELKDDLNALIDTFNKHTHPFTGLPPGTAGSTSKTPNTATNSQADMSDAKVEKVKTIGK